MVNANELRVGNEFEYLVEDKIGGNEWVRNSIDVGDITHSIEDNEYFNRCYRPIPLTPEKLEKLRFVKDRTGFSLPDKMSLSFSVDKEGKFIACWKDKSLQLPYELKHVHQVQNLYFALTGEELTYKP